MLPSRFLIGTAMAASVCQIAPGQTTRPSQPADRPEVQAAHRAVSQAVSALVKDLTSSNFAKRDAAYKALTALSEAVLTEVVAQSRLGDPEQLARAAELFTTLSASARQGQMLLSLTAEQRKVVAALAQADPKLFNSLFSENPSVAAKAVTRLAQANKRGADLVVAWAVRHEQWEVRLAALAAAGDFEKPDATLNDAVFHRMTKTAPKDPIADESTAVSVDSAAYAKDAITSMEHRAAVCALAGLKDKRILPRLLEILVFSNGQMDMTFAEDSTETSVLGMILELKDKRTVVTLMDHVKDNQELNNMVYENNRKVTIQRGDVAMVVILLQTAQKPADYGFFIPPDADQTDPPQLGFESAAKRKDARKKIRDWWEKNKKDYEGVERIPLGKEEQIHENARPNVPAFVPAIGNG